MIEEHAIVDARCPAFRLRIHQEIDVQLQVEIPRWLRAELTDEAMPEQPAVARERHVPVLLPEVVRVDLERLVFGVDEWKLAPDPIGSHEPCLRLGRQAS